MDLKNISKGNSVLKLAAKRLIRDLEEGRSIYHDNNGNIISGKDKDIVKEIVNLSVR